MKYINLFIWMVLLIGTAICKVKYALVGSTVNLTCKSGQWKFGQDQIPIDSNPKFAILNDAQFGTYTCDNVISITLVKGIKPTIVTFKEVPSIPENENLVLNCSIKGIPKVTAEWFKNGNEIRKGIQEISGLNDVTTALLQMNSVKLDDSGNYGCRGGNQFGNVIKTLDVTVYAALGTFTLSTKNLTSRSITLRWSRKQKLNSTWQDRQIFVQIESKLVSRNHSVPSVAGMGNIKLFTDLSPYTKYKFILREVAGNLRGNSTSITVNTLEDAPSQPTYITATIGKNFINLSWDAPKYANGIIKYYKVKYRSMTTGCEKEYLEKYTNASDTSLELTDLYSNIEYEIEVSAGTVKYGNATIIRHRTVADHPGNTTLKIKITEVNPAKVNISWNPLSVCYQGEDDLIYELEVKHVLSNITVKNYTNTTSYIFMGFSHYQAYGIILTPTNKHGKGAPSTKIFITPEGIPTAPFPPSVAYQAFHKDVLEISWKRPLLMNGKPSQYQIEFRKIKSCTSHECKRSIQLFETVNITRRSDSVPVDQDMTVRLVMKREVELDYFSKYEVRVRESTVKGWGPYSRTSQFIIGEGGASAPLNLTPKSVSHDSATIEWEEPKYPNGIIKSYYLLRKKWDQFHLYVLKINMVGKHIRCTINNLESETRYSIRICAINGYGVGRYSKVLVFTTSSPAVPGLFNLSMKNITSRSITLRWTRARKLNSTWQDRQIFVQIESKPGLIRNDSFPSIVGTGNMKLFTDLSPYTKYKFTLREVVGNFSGNSTSISFSTSEDAPSMPLNVRTKSVSHDTATIEWEEPEYPNGIIKSYNLVKRRGSSGMVSLTINTLGKHIRYTINNLDSKATYSILICAINGYGRGSSSDTLVFTTSAVPSESLWIFVLVGCLTLTLVVLVIIIAFLLHGRKKLQQYRWVHTVEKTDDNTFELSNLANDHVSQEEFELSHILPTRGFTSDCSTTPYNQG